MTQIQPRETNSLSDSQFSSQQDRIGEHEDELITAFASQLANRIDGTKVEQRPTEDPASIIDAAIRQDIGTFETIMRASEAERQKILAPLTAGEGRLPRVPLHREQPRPKMPKQSRHFLPRSGNWWSIGEAPAAEAHWAAVNSASRGGELFREDEV